MASEPPEQQRRLSGEFAMSAAERVLDSRPGPLGRLLARPVIWILAVALLSLAPFASSASRSVPKPPPVIAQLPTFELTDAHGQAFGSKQLEGKVWVANFVFTSCPSICPALMERMQQVQHRSRNAGAAVHMVTFSVDPETDTPERMAAYGRRFKASPYRWSLLTGDLAAIEQTVVSGFKLAMGKDADNLFQIFHSERLVLVDAEGSIRGYYEATDEGIDALMKDVGTVLNFG
jgi:protein SCO1/2